MIKILVVDDDTLILQAFARNLRVLGYTVFPALSAAESLVIYEREHPDLVLSDMQMADMDGVALLRTLRQLDPEAYVVLITGYADKETVQAVMDEGAADVVQKPINNVALVTLLRRAEAGLRQQRALRAAQAALQVSAAPLHDREQPAGAAACEEDDARTRVHRHSTEDEIRRLARFPAEDPNPVMRLRADGLIMYANAMTRALWPDWNYTAGAYVAAPIQALVAEALAQRVQKRADVDYASHVFELYLAPIIEENYVNLYARDITARRQTEQALAEARALLEQRVQERTAELTRANADLSTEIVERQRVEQALRESEQKFRALWDSAPAAAVLLDAAGHILLTNARAEAMFGYAREELLGLGVEALMPERFHGRHVQHRARFMAQPQVRPMGVGLELRGRRKEGSEFPVEVALSYLTGPAEILVMCLISDISSQKRVEAELAITRAKAIHAGKLASLGEMATGVAHELNQPLTAMQFEADYLKTLIEKKRDEARPLNEGEIYQIAGNLSQDIARCRRIINYLRAFGRTSGESALPINVNTAVEDSFVLTGEWLNSQGITIRQRLAPALPAILGDTHKLEQVCVSLFSNAAYAMAQRAAQAQAAGTPYTKQLEVATYLDAAGAVIVEVRDNGIGIPESHHGRIFEPFFTTKPVGEGAGLGLSVSYGIVTELGGEITFESAENAGATFRLRFPALM